MSIVEMPRLIRRQIFVVNRFQKLGKAFRIEHDCFPWQITFVYVTTERSKIIQG